MERKAKLINSDPGFKTGKAGLDEATSGLSLEVAEDPFEYLRSDKAVYAFIKSLGLTKNEVKANLTVLLEYQADQAICSSCPGRDKCPKDNKLSELSLELVGGRLKRFVGPCRKEKDRISLASRFFIASCPEEWFSPDPPDMENRDEVFDALLKATNGTGRYPWVYVIGDSNSGKSFILAKVANRYSFDHPGCAFVSTPDIVDELKDESIRAKAKFNSDMKRLEECPLLVFDDFGNEFMSEYNYSTIVYPLLNARAKAKAVTFFSSDFTFDEIASLYSSKIGEIRALQLKNLLRKCAGKEQRLPIRLNLD